jgi:AcrR family transcriptional regulator
LSETQREEQKRRTRTLLIETAFQLLARDGLLAARTGDIAKAAGVSHGTVFAHFPTREALLNAVIEEFGLRSVRRLHQLAGGGGSVRAVLTAHLQGMKEYEAFYTRLVAEARQLPESARNTLLMIHSAASHHLSRAAEAEMAAGTLRPMPLHLLFNTWLGLVHYYLVNGPLFAPGGSVLERHGPELLEHYLKLIRPDAAEEGR